MKIYQRYLENLSALLYKICANNLALVSKKIKVGV